MYFEFSLNKMIPIVGLALVLALAVLSSSHVNNQLQLANMGGNFFTRQRADFDYLIRYKLPRSLAAIAGSTVVVPDSASASANAHAIPVLAYHGAPSEGTDITPLTQGEFIDQMRALKDDGWNTITLEQFDAFMKGQITLPSKSFLLTFDDGRKESFYPVDPVLRDFGWSAVMFVITGFSITQNSNTSNFYLSPSELKYMAESGRWELQSHGDQDHRLYDIATATSTPILIQSTPGGHFMSNKFWMSADGRLETNAEYSARITNDLVRSKEILEQNFGGTVIGYAFPFNDYGQNTDNFPGAENIVARIVPTVYKYAFYQVNYTRGDPLNYPNPSTFMIKRIEPTGDMTGQDVVHILDESKGTDLPFSTTTFEPTNWGGSWGNVAPLGAVLSLSASNETTGAAAFLNGSQWWTDYTMTANFVRHAGEASLIARYNQQNSSFVSCTLEPSALALEEYRAGTQNIIATVPFKNPPLNSSETATLIVQGNTAICTSNGATVRGTIGKFFAKGGIGVQTWSPTKGSADIQVQSVKVTSGGIRIGP